jgi:hypothetical protein
MPSACLVRSLPGAPLPQRGRWDVTSSPVTHGVQGAALRPHSALGLTFAETKKSPSLVNGGSTTIRMRG